MRRIIFNVSITCISRVLVTRDLLLGRIGPFRIGHLLSGPFRSARDRLGSSAEAAVTRCAIPTGKSVLDAFFVTPVERPVQSVVLICHGIGEIVEHWLPV